MHIEVFYPATAGLSRMHYFIFFFSECDNVHSFGIHFLVAKWLLCSQPLLVHSRGQRWEWRVLKRPSSFHFYNPKSNSFSEEDHCAVSLNNVTCSLWYWRRTSVSCLWLRWHETSWGNVFLHWKLWRPTVFPLPRDFCCFFWSWVWWMPWDLLWPLWKLRKKNGSRKRVFSFSYPN